MAHCFKLVFAQCAVLAEEIQPGNRGSNPVAVNQFLIFFSIRFECSHSLPELEMLFILRSLLYVI